MIVYTVAIRNHKICTVLDDYHTANITKQKKIHNFYRFMDDMRNTKN